MEQLNITTGNAVNLHLTLTRLDQPFPLEWATDVVVNLLSTLGTRTALSPVINDDGTVDVTVPAVEKPGNYGIEVRGILNGNPWRTYTGGILRYTYATVPGASEATLQGDVYDITMVVQMNAPAAPLTQKQSDWAEEDDTLPAFIKNKPDVRSVWDMKIPQNPIAEERDYVPTVGSVADTLEGVEESLQGKQDTLNFNPPIVNDNGIPSIVETTTGNFNRIDDVATAEGDGWHNVQQKDRTLPTIAAIEAQGYLTEQVQIDWEETDSSLPAFIKHKPNIKYINESDIDNMTVTNGLFIVNGGSGGIIATVGHYVGEAVQFWLDAEHGYIKIRKMSRGTWGAWSDNLYYAKPTGGIPATDLAAAVQAALNRAASALMEETDPTVPAWAKTPQKPAYTAEEVGALPATTPIPVVPTNVSAFANDVGYLTQHQDISGKEDKMAIASPAGTAIEAVAGTYYRLPATVDTLAVTLPTMTDASKVATVVLYLTTGTAPAVTFASSHPVVYQDGFALEASKTYEVNCLFNGAAWVLMAAEINTGS